MSQPPPASRSAATPGSARTYTSTVVALVPAAVVTIASSAGALLILLAAGVTGRALLIEVIVLIVIVLPIGLRIATVRLAIGSGAVSLGQGLRGRARTIPLTTVALSEPATLRWPQVYGIGIQQHRRLTRLTVRAGPTLHLVLADGEHLWISTADPAAACTLFNVTTDLRHR